MGILVRAALAAAAAAGVTAVAPVLTAAPAAAATAAPVVAYVRGGDVYVSRGTTETRLTTGGGYARPRFSPDGRRLAYLRHSQLGVMRADGTGARRLSTRTAAGPSWSPDGRYLAFASAGCTGGPAVYRIAVDTAGAAPEVLFPADCRGEAVPDAPAATAPAGSLNARLAADDAVAWSPDGTRIAFRGGMCESTYDACLSVGTVATGGERTVAAYGGGGRQDSGFAVVPSWRGDGARLSWTAYRRGETTADDLPVHLVEYDPAGGTRRTVGAGQDREMAYADARRGVVTGQHRGGSWVLLVDLATGARTPLRPGSQPTVAPAAR